MRRQLRLIGVMVGSRAHQQAMVGALEGFDFRPVIDRTFPLEQLAAAFEHQKAGTHFGKICIRI